MKVYAYKVVPREDSRPLDDLLGDIEDVELSDRLRHIKTVELRLDELTKRQGCWLMDFVRARYAGPGKMSENDPVSGFDFQQGERFGEETAALYDPRSGYLLVQYNHFGVRAGAIQEYFTQINHDEVNVYELVPKYDAETERKLRRKTIFRKLDFKIVPARMTRQDRHRGEALSDVINLGHQYDANNITVTVSASRENLRGLNMETVRNSINSLKRYMKLDEEAIKSLKITGKDNIDDETEVLDLIAQRLFLEYNDLRLGPDLRIPLEDRWGALQRARRAWRDELK